MFFAPCIGLFILIFETRGLVVSQTRARSAYTASPGNSHDSTRIFKNSSLKITKTWLGKYGGVPPFGDVDVSEFEFALKHGLKQRRMELAAISQCSDKASFENTIAALDNVGRELNRVQTVYYVFLSTMSTPELRKIETKMAGELAAADDETYQNNNLFLRIKTVYEGPEYNSTLTEEQKRLTWKKYSSFVRNGAKLATAEKIELAQINQKLADLYTKFRHNLLADEQSVVLIENEHQLAGLEPGLTAVLKETAVQQGQTRKWAVTNTRSIVETFLAQAEDRSLRERVWRAFIKRGDNGGHNDNNHHIVEILKLRAKRAKILGYDTHANWQLETSMAGTPERVMGLLKMVWEPAVKRTRKEVQMQEKIARADNPAIEAIEPWDYRFYMEKVRKAKYSIDEAAVKPYMQLERIREGMFWSANKLYGLKFNEIHNVPVVHADVRAWEVSNSSGATIALYYFDPYARPGKRSGAWMQSYREQENVKERVLPIVSNTCNYVKPADGQPALISWSDASTMFHEFGHALHGILSNVHYRSLAGTNVARDYVEFPSQLHEHWLSSPEVLGRFALHVKTGEPIPRSLVQKLRDSKNFKSGFATVEYLASAFLDMELHLAGEQEIDPKAFESKTLSRLGMPSEIVMRHRLPQFAHAFASDGYSAAYYCYLWADTLTADAADAFKETGDMFDPSVAERLRQDVLMVGDSVDPLEGFKAFRGRDVRIEALMRDRGFKD